MNKVLTIITHYSEYYNYGQLTSILLNKMCMFVCLNIYILICFSGMIVFCLAFGLLAGQMGPRGKLMVDFFVVLNDIIMKLVGVVMW